MKPTEDSGRYPGLAGTYPDLFVPLGDKRRGKTHCRQCGGRTLDRDADNKACHSGCKDAYETETLALEVAS